MRRIIGVIFLFFFSTSSLFAQEAFSIIPIAEDSTLDEGSPYLTYYWYDGIFTFLWDGNENPHPIWLTYLESPNHFFQNVVGRFIDFNLNHHLSISHKFIISDSTKHIHRESPLIENYFLKPVSIWIEEESNNSSLSYSIFTDSVWSIPEKIISEPSEISSPVFITRDARSFVAQEDFFNRLFWLSDHSIHEVQLDSNFSWINFNQIYHTEDSLIIQSARIDRNDNLWLLFDEYPSKDSVTVKSLILPKDRLHWKGPFTLLNLHEKTSQATLNLIDHLYFHPRLVLNWIEKDCMYDTVLYYENDSIYFEVENQFINDQRFSNYKYASNSLLIGGCVIGYTPYFFVSSPHPTFTDLSICQTSLYSQEPFYSTRNRVKNLAISGLHNQHYAVSWSEFDGRQSDIYLYVDFIIIGDVEARNSSPPSSFRLYQNFPNPFNQHTIIRYYLPRSVDLEISVFNIVGQKVKVLFSGSQPAGNHSVIIEKIEFPSGVYFYVLKSRFGCLSKKFLVLR